MNVRSLLSIASLVASMALPSLAGAQVQVRAGIQIGTPPPPTVVVVQPRPQVVVVQQPAQPVYVVQPQPVVRPVYLRRGRRVRVVVAPSHHEEHRDGRHGGRGRRHR